MANDPIERCPTCQQRIRKGASYKHPFARICRKCKKPIRTHHKYKVVTDAEASWFEHRHCDNPDSYHPRNMETKS